MIIRSLQHCSIAKEQRIEYGFYLGDKKIGAFMANGRPALKSFFSVQGVFNGKFVGNQEYNITMRPIESPIGFDNFVSLSPDGTKTHIGNQIYDHIDENNLSVGQLFYYTIYPKKKHFWQFTKNYYYLLFKWKNADYYVYDVMTKENYNYCIYRNNTLVAIIEKDKIVKDWKDNYTIFALDDVDTDLLCLICSHWDYTMYEEMFYQQGNSYQVYSNGVTLSEFVRSKYDPSFKEKIKAAAELNNPSSNNVNNQ